jgi:hypothetical protein
MLAILVLLPGTAVAQNPVPFVDQPLVPDAAAPGGAGFTLTVNGAGFVPASVVNWNGSPRATTFVSSAQLTATILASDIATASTASVTVVSPSIGDGTSNTVFFPIHTPSASIAFTTTDYTVGSFPLYAATADFNGDGNPDLVVADNLSGSVSVLLGNGDGTFQAPVAYSIGAFNSPTVPIVGDFNGDGKIDIAVPNLNQVSVLLGNGDGTFQPPINSTIGGCGTTDAIAADFNRDGNLDLVGISECGPYVFIALGNGNGTFQGLVGYKTDGAQLNSQVAAADFNGDGFLDLAVSSGSISILLGNGDGTFQPAVPYSSGAGSVSIADLNGDGRPDLIVAAGGYVAVLLGNGDGTFGPAAEYPVDSGAIEAEVGDFNQDGKLDVAVLTYKPNLDILLGNGDGTLQTELSFPSVLSGSNLAVADFGGSGLLDAAVPGENISTIAVMLRTQSGAIATNTVLTSSPDPSAYGQAAVFTATVSSTSGAPTGTVILNYRSAVVGSGTLVGGTASIPVSSLPVGSDSITAAYQGSATFASSTSTPLIQALSAASTSTSLTSSPNPAGTDQTVTLTAVVSSQFGGTTTGTVTFFSGSQTLGTASLTGTQAKLATAFTTAQTYAITAQYRGDRNNLASTSAILNQKIVSSTTTVLASSPNPAPIDHLITFTATVTSSAGVPPNGELVTFYNGSAVLGTAALSGGAASFATSSLPSGVYFIAASYPGDPNFAASASDTLRQVVNSATKSATSTALASNPNPSIYGQSVTWRATVATTGPVPPTGKVGIVWSDNTVGTATLNLGGVATLARSSLNADSYPLQAVYHGDANNQGSTSAIVNQVIQQATSSATLTSSPDPSTPGEAVTFTAKITSPTVTAKGPVTFTAGKIVLGTVELSGGKATFTTSTLAAGSTTVTVTFAGDSNIKGSSASVVQSVQ